MGHEVTLLFNEGTPIHEQDIPIARRWKIRKFRPQLLRDFFFWLFAFFHCIKHPARQDAIHVHGDWSAFILGKLLGSVISTKVRVASIHGEIRQDWREKLYKFSLADYDVVYCTGNREAQRLKELGINKARWQPSGVSDEFLKASAQSIVYRKSVDVICVANLLPVKNIELLIQVAKQMPHISFDVVGDGPLKTDLIKMCRDLLVVNVRFRGSMNRKDLAQSLASSRLFYLPSWTEGTPTSMMEAMAMGLPVVLTPSNDYCDIVRGGINGHVTSDFSVHESVKAIDKLLTSTTQAFNAISTQNRQDAQSFAWREIADKVTTWMRPQ